MPTAISDVQGSMSRKALNFRPSLELDTQQSTPVQVSGRWQARVLGRGVRFVLVGQAVMKKLHELREREREKERDYLY